MELLKLRCKKPFLRSQGNCLTGFAFKFSEVAQVWGGDERMSENMSIRIDPDALLLRGHNPDKILGKVGKNLSFENDPEGLRFKVSKLPDTELGRETDQLIKEGLLDGVSIGFLANESRIEDGVTIQDDIKIIELSLVSRPAYDTGRIDTQRAKLIFEKKKPYKKFNQNKKEPLPPELC